MTVAPDSTSYPTIAACAAFGVPMDVGFSLGWAVILHARRQPLGFWELRAWEVAAALLSDLDFYRLCRRLDTVYRASGVIAS